MRKELKNIEKEKQLLKNEVLKHFKSNFKHIYGMWPKTANFENEA